jgi:dephospho-CoA kinase
VIRIGLTGPIGCGKSTVARWLVDEGAVVIDADEVAREVAEPGTPAFGQILSRFGDGLRGQDGSLDRAALGRIVFADPQALADLEAIVHPAVRRRIVDTLRANEADRVEITVIEAIKLVEGGLAPSCDAVWLVVCDQAIQRERLGRRSGSLADADQRIAAQGAIAERLRPAATRVIDTSGSVAETKRLVADALRAAKVGERRTSGSR